MNDTLKNCKKRFSNYGNTFKFYSKFEKIVAFLNGFNRINVLQRSNRMPVLAITFALAFVTKM